MQHFKSLHMPPKIGKLMVRSESHHELYSLSCESCILVTYLWCMINDQHDLTQYINSLSQLDHTTGQETRNREQRQQHFFV